MPPWPPGYKKQMPPWWPFNHLLFLASPIVNHTKNAFLTTSEKTYNAYILNLCFTEDLILQRKNSFTTALDLLLVFFHFKNENADLIYWYTCLFSPLFTLRHAILNLLFTRILAKTCISMSLCQYLFIHAQKSGGELHFVFRVDAAVCAHAL